MIGVAEPEYGRDYIHSIKDRVKGQQPYQDTSIEDLHWIAPDHTNVETATFYFHDVPTGCTGIAQVIHSNIIGLHTAAQFTFRCCNTKNPEEFNIWTSTKLENFRIEGANFYADNLAIEFNEDGTECHVSSQVTPDSDVDFVFKRLIPGAKVGSDGTTYFGDNLQEPWGMMRHVFWPRNHVKGEIRMRLPSDDPDKPTERSYKFDGENPTYGMFVMAFQGMKPHHAAKSWNFLYFNNDKHTVVVMEFVTPKSYANTKVSVAILTDSEKVLAVTVDNDVSHLDCSVDSVGWNVPKALKIEFQGLHSSVPTEEIELDEETQEVVVKEDQRFNAIVEGPLDYLVARVDVMGEVPNFVKNIVSGVAGTKPYIYQYGSQDGFSVKIGDGPESKGFAWTEVTFISENDIVTEESYNEE